MKRINILTALTVIIVLAAVSIVVASGFRTIRATGTGNIATTLAPNRDFQLWAIKLNLSRAGSSGDFTVTSDANAGAAYDTNLLTQDLTAVTDLVITYNPPIPFDKGDELDVAWTNAATITYGLEIDFRPSY